MDRITNIPCYDVLFSAEYHLLNTVVEKCAEEVARRERDRDAVATTSAHV